MTRATTLTRPPSARHTTATAGTVIARTAITSAILVTLRLICSDGPGYFNWFKLYKNQHKKQSCQQDGGQKTPKCGFCKQTFHTS
jgi:hypothetical protein